MLKRLELVGFKSFADKTEFVFAPGVTGIVGPNGSGKSNMVDAVRWVLGEQSAKSLRGGEMADVIFNGSATRRSLGLAEVTMTFDNSRRVLATEADEVQITRRVYRSGEGEYLINGQACRLKDIKDLFLGSGAGTDAYCIIEQGRVDVLLQASTKDRRTIFEEAAGISRFKAKKIETLRRLERVDQNLQRLKRHRRGGGQAAARCKLQAAKAQRCQEYTARLKELRVGLGLREYRPTHGISGRENAGIRGAAGGAAAETEQADAWERDLRRLEESLSGWTRRCASRRRTCRRRGSRSPPRRRRSATAGRWPTTWRASWSRTRRRLAELTHARRGPDRRPSPPPTARCRRRRATRPCSAGKCNGWKRS